MIRRFAVVGFTAFVMALALLPGLAAPGDNPVATDDLKEWLTYISSDELEGRATYGSGLGLAAGYIQEHLRRWDVQPAGGGYVQTVRVLGVRATSRSRVTVHAGGSSRTFTDGAGVRFPRNSGGKRTLAIDRVEFAGYGLDVPAAKHADYRGKDVKGAAVVWLGSAGPKSVDPQVYRRLLSGRTRYATEQLQAAASIGPETTASSGTSAQQSNRGDAAPDFTTAQRLDRPIPPAISAGDAFFEFLFAGASVPYAELKRKAAAQEPLPTFRLDGVRLTFEIDADYEIVRTQFTQNVIGIVEGTDPQLKHTYVAFGAHYDHVGYADGELTAGGSRRGAPGRVTATAVNDRVWNGADDDGSGTVALMAMAKAFAAGPRPKRSLLFVWHAGEERGLLGSRYFADYPPVPLDAIVAQLNADMIGRNRDDKPGEAHTVYLVGSDRISSELHEINRQANRALAQPLTLDYEMNDPADLEQVYYRSDHYSYAAKGIPVIFFTTGLHDDYHANTDHVEKIEFEKLARVTGLMYETGVRLANLEHAPARDNRGPRAGRDTR
jgi:hypothetical protein